MPDPKLVAFSCGSYGDRATLAIHPHATRGPALGSVALASFLP